MPVTKYETLNDAAQNPEVDAKYQRVLEPGKTEIWYAVAGGGADRERARDLRMGAAFYQELGHPLPLPSEVNSDGLWNLLGTVKGTHPEELWTALQGDFWSPNGEANVLLRVKGLTHTSMDLGDIVIVGNRGWMVDGVGFKELPGSKAEQAKMLAAAQRKRGGPAEGVAMRGVLRRLEEGKVVGSGGLQTAYWSFQKEAQERFLSVAAAEIKKVAKGHAERVAVDGSSTMVWLGYEGQTRGDVELSWSASLIDMDDNAVLLHCEADVPGRKIPNVDVHRKVGELVPQDVVDQFVEVFGR